MNYHIGSLPSLALASRFNLLFVASLLTVIAMDSPALGFQQQINNGLTSNLTTTTGRVAISNGTRYNVLDDGWIRVSSGGADIVAATVSDNSVLTLSGTGMISAATGDADATAVLLNQNAQLIVAGGSISSSNSNGRGDGIVANDQSRIEFFTGADLSFVNVNANDDSSVDISGGSYSFPRFVANGNASFNISGGELSQAIYTVNDTSSFTISGGDTGPGTLNANDLGTFNLLGSNFNRPLGPVSATSGIITGELEDGTSFSYSFQRGTNASIILAVPEPSSLAVLAFAGGLIGLRRKRRLSL